MNGLLSLLQMIVRSLTGYERRQREKAMKIRLRQELNKPTFEMDPAALELDLTSIQTGQGLQGCPRHGNRCGKGCMARHTVRRDCAFCGRERSPADDNHADDCPYWTVGPGRTDL